MKQLTATDREIVECFKAAPIHAKALAVAALAFGAGPTNELPKLRTRYPREAWIEAIRTAKAQKDTEIWLPVADFIEHDFLKEEKL